MNEWNRAPGGSAPTFEELVEKIRQQFKAFKGRSSLIIAALVLVVVFWTAWFTVQPEETGIVQRFGKVLRTAGPGLHFKLPFGIETARMVPTARVLKEEFGFRTVASVPGEKTRYDPSGAYKDESLMLTGDLNVIDVQWIIQYRIEDPIRFLFHVRETPKTIRDITEAVMRRAVGNRIGSDVLTTGRVAVASEAKIEIQKILSAYESGVRLVTVELQDVTPPDTVKPAFNEVDEAIDRVMGGLQKKNRMMNVLEKETVAFHESGHAIVAESVEHADPVHKVSVIPRGIAALGYTQQQPTEDRYLMTRSELVDRLAVLLGGRVAEELVFNEISTGAQNDLQRASDIARAMVTEYGMSDLLGLVSYERPRQAMFPQENFLSGKITVKPRPLKSMRKSPGSLMRPISVCVKSSWNDGRYLTPWPLFS